MSLPTIGTENQEQGSRKDPSGGEWAMSSIEEWDSDHTALVHVLWAAKRQGIELEDADELASFIRRSKWFEAVHLHALRGKPTQRYEWMDTPTKTPDRQTGESAQEGTGGNMKQHA